jgi:predicted nucleic acid-binding Zn ribbon protein
VERARDILLGLAADRPDRDDWTSEIALAHWDDAVGELLARVSRPAALAGRLLIVEVDEPRWVRELEMVSGLIRRRLNTAAGRDVVGRVVYRLRRAPIRPAGRARTSEAEPADPMRRKIFRDSKSRG